jgi:hypothetical protein
MALSQGSLNDVRKELSKNLDDVLNEDQRSRLSSAFPDSALDGYEGAGDTSDEAEALAEAAAEGGLTGGDGAYSKFYQRNPDIREALSRAAEKAFDDSASEDISQLADTEGLSNAYSHCSRGNFQEAAEAAGLDSINVDTANECRNQIATLTDYAENLFSAYQPEDSTRDYDAPSMDDVGNE